jgi:hypothetical protein
LWSFRTVFLTEKGLFGIARTGVEPVIRFGLYTEQQSFILESLGPRVKHECAFVTKGRLRGMRMDNGWAGDPQGGGGRTGNDTVGVSAIGVDVGVGLERIFMQARRYEVSNELAASGNRLHTLDSINLNSKDVSARGCRGHMSTRDIFRTRVSKV